MTVLTPIQSFNVVFSSEFSFVKEDSTSHEYVFQNKDIKVAFEVVSSASGLDLQIRDAQLYDEEFDVYETEVKIDDRLISKLVKWTKCEEYLDYYREELEDYYKCQNSEN